MQRLFVHEKELSFWRDDAIYSSAPDGFRPFFDAARNAFNAYGEKLVPFHQASILPGIQTVPLFGHTPGHTGYLLGSDLSTANRALSDVPQQYVDHAKPGKAVVVKQGGRCCRISRASNTDSCSRRVIRR